MNAPLDILVVDDDPAVREIVRLALALDPAIRVRGVGTGGEALALLRAGSWRPDAMLLDFTMPGMDGPTLAGEIRRLPACDAVPLVFLTARSGEADMAACRAAGAAGVIAKPFDPIGLAAELRAALVRHGAGDAVAGKTM